MRILTGVFEGGYIYLYKALMKIDYGMGAEISSMSMALASTPPDPRFIIFRDMTITRDEIVDLLLEGYNKIKPSTLADRLMVLRL